MNLRDSAGQYAELAVAGSLGFTIADGEQLAKLSEGSWRGLLPNLAGTHGSLYYATLFRSEGQSSEEMIIGFSNGPIYHSDGGAWSRIGNVTYPKKMCVGDLDGPEGPEPESLFIAGRQGVFQWDGLLLRQLAGGESAADCGGLHVWDEDGEGPQPPRLFAAVAGGTATRGVRMWTGNAWVLVTQLSDPCYDIRSFDFDGDGPATPDLVVGQNGRVLRCNQGAWSAVGPAQSSNVGAVYTISSFDPDGGGPIQAWLVAGGVFTQMGGVAANRIAAYFDSSWHPFPNQITGNFVSFITVVENLQYSNSPQLIVAAAGARPCLNRFGLCDSPARINGDAPSRSRQPEGQSATFDVVPAGDELTFRWYKGDTALVDGATTHGSNISGVYGPRLTIANVRARDIGQYHAKVFNPLGQARSRDVALTVGCTADFNLDNTVDVSDYLDFIADFAANEADADFNADRVIDFFDYLDFVNQFASGC